MVERTVFALMTALVVLAWAAGGLALWFWVSTAMATPMVVVFVLAVGGLACAIGRVAGAGCAAWIAAYGFPLAVLAIGWWSEPGEPAAAAAGPPLAREMTEQERIRDAHRDWFGRAFVAIQPTLTPPAEDMAPAGALCLPPGWTPPPDLPGEHPRTWGPTCSAEQWRAYRAGDFFALLVPGHAAGERWAAEARARDAAKAAAKAAAAPKRNAEGVPLP